jgi:hypothetical protein|nr:MAG: hypothetical protein [Bacteriophage sp.]UVY30247.1 MAG: hypothetical protein [Bacteriophage sp.]UWF89360.1 MAG: hypothetical protein [Bacteriophage sp.]UWG04431.1 MAG: hypothetical protein [Bacteriophage sp.]UWG91449.1 MAG: hypothetical protein [Bacteriophage sp.]
MALCVVRIVEMRNSGFKRKSLLFKISSTEIGFIW